MRRSGPSLTAEMALHMLICSYTTLRALRQGYSACSMSHGTHTPANTGCRLSPVTVPDVEYVQKETLLCKDRPGPAQTGQRTGAPALNKARDMHECISL